MKKPFVVEVRAGAKQRSVPNLSEAIRRLVELGLRSQEIVAPVVDAAEKGDVGSIPNTQPRALSAAP